jgi:phosphopantothenoylcysteine decarboxylase/phosphopantothenate--cysteine ligase
MNFLITAGGTREYIDPVRFISNASSGKMGYALARAAVKVGHNVTLISASGSQPPVGVDFVGVESAAEMFSAVKKFFPKCDCLIMAAAVSDYTPAEPSETKIKKSGSELTIKLKPTADILTWAGKHKNDSRFTSHASRIVVGFALEDKDLKSRAEGKLKSKNLDIIIANSPDTIAAETTVAWIKTPNKDWLEIPETEKSQAADKIIRQIEQL